MPLCRPQLIIKTSIDSRFSVCTSQNAIVQTSRDKILINTGERGKRTGIFEIKSDLENIDSDSTDVMCNVLLEYYVNNLDEHESCCFADFGTKFIFKNLKKYGSEEIYDDSEDLDENSLK